MEKEDDIQSFDEICIFILKWKINKSDSKIITKIKVLICNQSE